MARNIPTGNITLADYGLAETPVYRKPYGPAGCTHPAITDEEIRWCKARPDLTSTPNCPVCGYMYVELEDDSENGERLILVDEPYEAGN